MSELQQTLEWHKRVNEAKAQHFGEQALRARIQLARDLIEEETFELDVELGWIAGMVELNRPVTDEMKMMAAKEMADVLFVVCQAAYTLGIPLPEVFAEVLKSNYSKLEVGIEFDERGKLLKGPNYQPAELRKLFDEAAE
jgi:NTP pyrophosphatase (non-canonical NTP hydrolase)